MARARNIKPSFFRNPDLAELDSVTRLLFIGLWTIADREGRLEDRPRYIKFELLPSDQFDIDGALDALQSRGFILRYTHGARRFIQVLNFVKHQNPHVKEAPSTIPAPGEHDASTVLATLNPESPLLNPDSGNLIPDSLLPEPDAASAAEREQEDEKKPKRPQQKYPDDFETFWKAYPSGNGNKARSYDQWKRIAPDAELMADILAGVELWKQSDRWKRGFVKAAETWLKDAWWANDPPGIPMVNGRKSLDIRDYAPSEWPALAYGPVNSPEERELSRQAAERLMG